MKRLTIICISFIIVSLMFAGQSYAKVNPETILGVWLLDEGTGDIAKDSSINGNHGTLGGGPAWIAGVYGKALDFSGTNSYVDCGNAEALNVEIFSVSFWCNIPNTQSWNHIISRGEHFGGNPGAVNWGVMMYADQETILYEVYNDAVKPSLSANTTTGEWHHVVITHDEATMQLYHDGQLAGATSAGILLDENLPFIIGAQSRAGGPSDYFDGSIDDVGYFNTVLAPEDIEEIMNNGLAGIVGGITVAYNPDPADGALHEVTWATLSWQPSDFAVSHNVYMGDNFDDVNDGTGDTFRINQTGTFYVAGFTGYAYPDGLVPGTTYYWRIDEVNDADPNSPWKGNVWSFWIPPKKAYEPVPSDGGKFIDSENLILSWTSGFGAKLHTVYFGDNFDTVANATGGQAQAVTNFNPGPLELEKTYYWRVDEFVDVVNTYTGDVWSFTTAKAGGGIRGDYYRGMNFENFVLTRTDPEINFNWGDPGGPDATVGDDNFSCRWTGEVEAAFTETYTFYAAADDGVRLWVDGVQLVNAWVDQGTTEYSGTFDLVAGNTYSIVMEQYENGSGATAYLRWSSASTPKQIIPEAALAPPIKASSPSPSNGATGTKMTPILRWDVGDFAASHEVYFGADANAVKNATTASPEYKGPKALGDETYDPGKLAWATSYYWRVDEVNATNPDSPWIGNLWSFTTGDFLVIDDFEEYDAGENQIWYSWHDGLGYGTPGTEPYFAGNGTGAAVGDENTASYTEETIVNGGIQSMPLAYDNNKQGYSKYSETELTLTAPRDWTEEGVTELSLWFRGYPGSTGSFVESPVGTYTMTGSGTDIWDAADEFHYAFKMLSGTGSIVAKVLSVDNTDLWAKAGVMFRETLDAGSKFAAVYITPGYGCRFQARIDTNIDATSDTLVATAEQIAVTAPYWVKLERDVAGNFRGYYSANGSTWQQMSWNPLNVSMSTNVYIGLAVTSHNTSAICEAVFSNVTITGTVGTQWTSQDIGMLSNDAEPMYVAVSNIAGAPAVVYHDDPAAATIDTWTEWVIPLQAFADQGIVLTNVDRIAIGLGSKGNMTVAGGSGKMFFDDIRLYRPAPEPEPEPEPEP